MQCVHVLNCAGAFCCHAQRIITACVLICTCLNNMGVNSNALIHL